jgi:hypothetical protein
MFKALFLTATALSALAFGTARADTVNVPAYNVNFGNLGTPVTLDLAAGTYNISYAFTGASGQFAAWDIYASNFGAPNQGPAVGGCDASGANCGAGWQDGFGYTVNGAAGAAGSVFSGSGEQFATAAQALAAYSAALPSDTFSLASNAAVTFFIPDYSYNVDNYGGVSLAVTSVTSVPEPASIAILGCGLLALAGFAARGRKTSTSACA